MTLDPMEELHTFAAVAAWVFAMFPIVYTIEWGVKKTYHYFVGRWKARRSQTG
jgi:hypothetical protein